MNEINSFGGGLLAPATNGASPPTMSTREIAEVCKKRHDNVVRDTENMLDELKLSRLSFEGAYQDAQNKARKCYNLPRDLTMTLATGYSIPLRKRLVDRLDEIEGILRNRPALDYSDPQVLLGVVNHLQGQVVAKDAVIAHQGERLTKLDRIEGAVGNLTVTEAAKVLKVKPRFLTNFLCGERWIYKRPNSGHWLAYQSMIPKFLDHRDHTYKDDDGETHFVTYAVVTPAGMVKLAAMLEAHFAGSVEAK